LVHSRSVPPSSRNTAAAAISTPVGIAGPVNAVPDGATATPPGPEGPFVIVEPSTDGDVVAEGETIVVADTVALGEIVVVAETVPLGETVPVADGDTVVVVETVALGETVVVAETVTLGDTVCVGEGDCVGDGLDVTDGDAVGDGDPTTPLQCDSVRLTFPVASPSYVADAVRLVLRSMLVSAENDPFPLSTIVTVWLWPPELTVSVADVMPCPVRTQCAPPEHGRLFDPFPSQVTVVCAAAVPVVATHRGSAMPSPISAIASFLSFLMESPPVRRCLVETYDLRRVPYPRELRRIHLEGTRRRRP
jgi:hypothetical protein